MPTSQTSSLYEPKMGEMVPLSTFGYFRARAQRRAYDMVIREFKKSGLTQSELAQRLGKGTDQVSRMLAGPGNWTIKTASDLLFAISGAEPEWGISYPLQKARRNRRGPEWLTIDSPLMRIASNAPSANTSAPITDFLSRSIKEGPKKVSPLGRELGSNEQP